MTSMDEGDRWDIDMDGASEFIHFRHEWVTTISPICPVLKGLGASMFKEKNNLHLNETKSAFQITYIRQKGVSYRNILQEHGRSTLSPFIFARDGSIGPLRSRPICSSQFPHTSGGLMKRQTHHMEITRVAHTYSTYIVHTFYEHIH